METARIYSKPLKLTIFFGRVVHWATGKPTDTKGASNNSRNIRWKPNSISYSV